MRTRTHRHTRAHTHTSHVSHHFYHHLKQLWKSPFVSVVSCTVVAVSMAHIDSKHLVFMVTLTLGKSQSHTNEVDEHRVMFLRAAFLLNSVKQQHSLCALISAHKTLSEKSPLEIESHGSAGSTPCFSACAAFSALCFPMLLQGVDSYSSIKAHCRLHPPKRSSPLLVLFLCPCLFPVQAGSSQKPLTVA